MLDNAADILIRLARSTGQELVSFRQKDIEPVTDGVIVGYACTLRTPSDVIEDVTIYVNTAWNAPVDSRTTSLVDARGNTLTAWAYPQDPALPSLPAVSYPEAAGVVLDKFGIDARGARLTMESYRPGKRAVLRVDGVGETYFAKVVQPSLAGTIHELHERFRAAGVPVPRSLGFSDAGLVLLEQLPGDPAIDHITTLATTDRFRTELDELIASIGEANVPVGARESLARRASWYADRMIETAPVLAATTARLTEQIDANYRASPETPPVTIHGDLHLGQIFVDPEPPHAIVGVLDIDTAGLGDPADDAGALYGHVLVSRFERAAIGDQRTARALDTFGSTLRSHWPREGRVRAIAATHLVGHALAVAGRGEEHLPIAEQLLDAAKDALR